MLGVSRNGIDLICKEQSIPEFPNLLFGKEIESGRMFFDATFYINQEDPSKNVRNFFAFYKVPIESLCEAYDIEKDDFFKINKNGHYLVDSNLVYLFIAFVEPNFLGYMCDRIHEIFTHGVSVSDTYLLVSAKERLSEEVLKAISNGTKSTEVPD